jgi:glucose-6-phosphate 1-dehydrogenase
VAKAGWNLDQLKARAKDSLEKHGGLDQEAFNKLTGLLRYVDGDYNDPKAFAQLRKELGSAKTTAALLCDSTQLVRHGCRGAGQVGLR